MTTETQKAVSRSLAQLSSAQDRRWIGLCVESCHALNWPLSLENLGAVKASLLSIYALRLRAALAGGESESHAAEWYMFAQKAQADLSRDSKRMLMQTEWSWLNCLQSSLTRRIYSNRRKLQKSQNQSFNGPTA